MDQAKKLVLNIVGWNSCRFFPRLFSSLDRQDMRDFSVTVVDNASGDDTISWLEQHRPEVTLLRNFKNQGFSRAHNQAIALAVSRWAGDDLSHRYVLVTNPDLEFAPDALRLLMAYMDAHPEVGACGPKLLRVFRKPQETSNGDESQDEYIHSTTFDSTGLEITKARRVYDRAAGEEDKGQYDDKTKVFGISGACLLLRASAIQQALCGEEFFDEDLFAYKEDVDVAWRMQRLGFEIHVVPHARVWHHRRAPSAPKSGWLGAWHARAKKSPFVNYLSTRNHRWVLIKNDEWGNALLHAPWWLPYEIAKGFSSLLSWSALKGELDSLRGWPKMWRKRRLIASKVVHRGSDLRRWFV